MVAPPVVVTTITAAAATNHVSIAKPMPITPNCAAEGANVMVVHHDRTDVDLDIRDAILEITMETQDREHAQRVINALREGGFKVS